MRWEALFADLEAQVEAARRQGLDGDVADLTRAEWAALSLVDRLQAQVGHELVWWTVDGERLAGRPIEVGLDWVLLDVSQEQRLLPVEAMAAVAELAPAADPVPAGAVLRRLPLSVLLRGLARDRALLVLSLRGGRQVTGTVDRVGADHLDLAIRRADEPWQHPRQRLTVPTRTVLQLRVR